MGRVEWESGGGKVVGEEGIWEWEWEGGDCRRRRGEWGKGGGKEKGEQDSGNREEERGRGGGGGKVWGAGRRTGKGAGRILATLFFC